MTRKHFEAVARAIREEVDSLDEIHTVARVMCRLSLLGVAERLADVFAEESGRFDRDRFLTACGFDL